MIELFEISGLKCVRKVEVECKKLNLLVGTNSSGKSTVFQGLLLLSQNMERHSGLNGELVRLGTYRESACIHKRDGIEIKLTAENESVSLRFTPDEYNKYNMRCDNEDSLLGRWLDYRNQHFQYLSCQRIGAEDVYAKNLKDETKVGVNGEFAPFYLLEHGSDPLDENLRKYKESYTLTSQLNWWMKYITGAQIRIEDLPGTDSVRVIYSMNQCDNIRPRNIGSGNSYLLSVLTLLLASQKGDALLIENPEIHLHPMSQSRLCEFFYFIAASGRQIFVESHSDHIFNGIRAGIAVGTMAEEDIAINFLSLDEEQCTKNTVVKIGKRGKILNQEKHLFDQFDADLEKMLGS